LCHCQFKDGQVDSTGYIGPYYSVFAVLILLGPRGIVVI
jgi:hypothetical protein